ncbi:MAG: T9SS type A sorting domain-containing protein [Candidatus Kapabacteria bacterium]|nr:T9SS type A sorting domain-containing protein [Ignavibacteriota bacterium]MCW5883776.1 T9SS type A sorting domain-containing protein [Candidatus Kapabacteria bacterium]
MKYIIHILVFFFVILQVQSQTYSIKKYVIGSSATTVENGDFKVSSTLGQYAIGKQENQNNISYSGFWFPASGTTFAIHKIFLAEGWNIISSFVEPENTSIPVVWDEVKNNIVIVKNSTGGTYLPAFSIDNIINWNKLEGYQVYASQSDTLAITGNQLKPEDNQITLTSGWKIISYLRNSPMNVKDALKSLTDDDALVIAKNNSGGTYLPMFDINTIGNMVPGQGYQIFLSKNSSLTYPANSLGKRVFPDDFIIKKPSILIPEHSRTGNSSVLLVLADYPDETEIGVYTDDEILVGSGVFANSKAAITIWGDNPQTSHIDGAKQYNLLKIKTLNSNSKIIMDLNLIEIFDGMSGETVSELTYKQDAFYIARSIYETYDNESLSLTASPNPFREDLEIKFNLQSKSDVSINIYSLEGSHVSALFSGSLNQGNHIFNLSGGNLASGEYTAVLNIGSERFVKKIMRLK